MGDLATIGGLDGRGPTVVQAAWPAVLVEE
jgi:hypothetical protein